LDPGLLELTYESATVVTVVVVVAAEADDASAYAPAQSGSRLPIAATDLLLGRMPLKGGT
jgi:hypothetical protein